MLIELNLLHIMAISIQELCKYIHARFGTSGNMGRNQRSHNNYGLEEVLLGTMYELPSDNKIAEVVIEEDCVLGRIDPTVIERNSSNKRAA